MNSEQIAQLRTALNMTPTEFGVALGMSEKSARITVWRWESNRVEPSTQALMLMKTLRPKKRKNAR